MSNKEKYRQVFEKVFDKEAEQFNEEFTFAAVKEWDSLVHLTLISELEAAFDVMFAPEDILHFGGYENGRKILKKYGVDFGE